MITRLGTASLAVLLAGLCAGNDGNDAVKDDRQLFQGEWVIDSAEFGGTKAANYKDLKLIVNGDEWNGLIGGKGFKFTTDATKRPKQFDLTRDFGGKKSTWMGIYEIEGNTLTICRSQGSAGERPNEFKAGPGIVFIDFKRAVSANADEDKPPPNEPPQLWRAAATEDDGNVVIQIARPMYEVPRKGVSAETMKWQNVKKVTLGESVRAFGVDGKSVEAKTVLKTLRQPKGVAVFVRFNEPLLDPDPFYLSMLREGTIVLVVAADAILDPIP